MFLRDRGTALARRAPVTRAWRYLFSACPLHIRLPRETLMPYVITEACINTKDKACVDVCPVDCIYEGPDQLYIHPDECIDCGACEPECPVTAIFPEEDVPVNLQQFVQLNRDVFKSSTPPGRPTR
jgi:NAD-dependent dihydropyrimidine dehydrogenase PreA subunit